MRLAQTEIELRMDAYQREQTTDLDRELQMLARMNADYPNIPVELAEEFARRINAGSLTRAAWDEAVAWLEATDWFRQQP